MNYFPDKRSDLHPNLMIILDAVYKNYSAVVRFHTAWETYLDTELRKMDNHKAGNVKIIHTIPIDEAITLLREYIVFKKLQS